MLKKEKGMKTFKGLVLPVVSSFYWLGVLVTTKIIQLQLNDQNTVNSALGASYFENQSKIMKEVANNLKGNETALVLFAIMSQQNNNEIAKTFKAERPVKPTTGNDVLNTVAGTTVPTLIQWGAGAFLGNEIVKGLSKAGKVTVKGDGNNMNYKSGNAYQDGNANLDASRPDNSGQTHNEYLAPEEPEIPEGEVPEGEFVPTEPPAEFDDLPIDIPEIPAE